PGDGGRLARPGDAEEGLEPLPRLDARGQLGDRLGLVAGRLELGNYPEGRHARPGYRRPPSILDGKEQIVGFDIEVDPPNGLGRRSSSQRLVEGPFEVLGPKGVEA